MEEINGPLTVEPDVRLGELMFGQVLVKVLVSGICGAQLQEIAGDQDNAKFVPHLLGHEGCGMVEEVGMAVTRSGEGRQGRDALAERRWHRVRFPKVYL